MAQSQGNLTQVRQAGLSDADVITDLLIAAMPEDRDWWNYRYPYRAEFAEDHKHYFSLLVKIWLQPEFDDWLVTVVETRVDAQGKPDPGSPFRIVSYAAWDVSYVNYRKHGPDYQAQNPKKALEAAGSGQKRDANALHVSTHSEAANDCHTKYLDAAYGTEQIHLQSLGTHPAFVRRGSGSLLCRWGMERAARDGVVMTLLASPMGRLVYPRLGFRELGQVTAQVPGEEECTFLYAMAFDRNLHKPVA